jgi:hypothetical protein
MLSNDVISNKITNWMQFSTEVRSRGCQLLRQLDKFPNSILVTGCQRSGTTLLSRIITQSEGMVNYWFGSDDELSAALILSGTVPYEAQGRYCFQTTFLNECYREYFEGTADYKLVWVLRKPPSVIYSMLYNWKDYGLDELFLACGVPLMGRYEKLTYRLFGLSRIDRLKRAALAYNGKVSQLFELVERLPTNQLLVIDYEDLVKRKEILLPAIYDFLDLRYSHHYAEKIHTQSLGKANQLSAVEMATIQTLCQPVYLKARQLLTPLKSNGRY